MDFTLDQHLEISKQSLSSLIPKVADLAKKPPREKTKFEDDALVFYKEENRYYLDMITDFCMLELLSMISS